MRKQQQVQDDSSPAAYLEPLEARTLLSGDMVLDWNEVAVEATRVQRASPPVQTRVLAMVQGAVFDAVNGIERDYAPYLVKQHAPRWASAEAAAAAAAHGVLVGLMSVAQQSTLDAALASSLATIRDGRAEDAGVTFGRLVADRMLAERRDDGSNDVVAYVVGTDPDDWQPTPPAYAAASVPQWATLAPFGIHSPDQFRAAPPPSIDSPEFTAAFNQVKAIGASNSVTRTADQTEIALYWAGPSGTIQPPGHWNSIARGVASAEGNTHVENARMLALLNFGMADAMIAGWDSKFTYNYVRPVTAIRNADHDPNPDTVGDAAWSSLIGTPPHPSYTSTHSTVSAAAATVLAGFFGTDAIAFTSTVETSPGGPRVTRSFDGFWEAAEEASASRVYGGIHWSFDSNAGLQAGRGVGGFITDELLRSNGEAGRDGDDDESHRSRSHGHRLTAVAGEGEGMVNVTPTAGDPGFSAQIQVSVRKTSPNTTFNVKRAVDFTPDGVCTSDAFVQFPLPNPGPLVQLTTSEGGAGAIHISFARPQIADGTSFDVRFELSTPDGSIVLRTDCFTVDVS